MREYRYKNASKNRMSYQFVLTSLRNTTMSRSALVVCVVAVFFFLSLSTDEAAANPVCFRAHEYWNDCGSACPLTCEYPEARACIKRCDAGCHCEEGYVRRRDGACVLHCDCF